MKSNKERKAKERQRKKEMGLLRREYWSTPKGHEKLKQINDDILKNTR